MICDDVGSALADPTAVHFRNDTSRNSGLNLENELIRFFPASRKQQIAVVSGGLVLLCVVVAIILWRRHHKTAVAVDPQTYSKMVSAFYVGTMALQVDDNPRAKVKMTLATQLVPDEAAAWANLGLYYLRVSDFDAASKNLDRALSLAPGQPQIS